MIYFVAYRKAWYLCHRIRNALYTPHALMKSIVEVDETYVGGKVKGRRRRYNGNKTIVLGAVERKGKVQMQTAKRANRITLRQSVKVY